MRRKDTIISMTEESEMADPNVPVAIPLVDAMPIDPHVVYVHEEVFIEERMPVNDVLYCRADESNGQHQHKNGAEWLAFKPVRISGWVMPHCPDGDTSYIEDLLAVTTDPDGFPLNLDNSTSEVCMERIIGTTSSSTTP